MAGRWRRTWMNKDQNQGDFILNSPDGWVTDDPRLSWVGSDDLSKLLAQTRGSVKLGDAWGETGAEVHSSASAFPAITRASSLICDTIAAMPWLVVRGRETLDTPLWIEDPALLRPDFRVSDYEATGVNPLSPVSFRSELVNSALWYGDAFILTLSRDANGQPIPPLFLIHPALIVVVTPALTSSQFPEPGYWVETSEGQWTRLRNDEIVQVRGMGPYWNGRGMGVLTAHMDSWEDAQALRGYSTGLYTAGVPAGYLKVTAPNLTETQAQDLKTKWASAHGGGKREIAVLNSVTDFNAIQMPPEQAQMVEAKRMGILDVANAFGVEPYMLGLPSDGSTYANIESRSLHFVRYTLLPWVSRIESALSALLPRGTDVKIDLSGLARADSSVRTAYYESGLAGGWLTPDEVRQAEGLAPAPRAPDTQIITGPQAQPSTPDVPTTEDPGGPTP